MTNMKKQYLVLFAVISLVLAAVLFVLSNNKTKQSSDSGKIKVAASIFPVANLIEQIGGGNVEVVQVLPNGASAHTFEIAPQERIKLVDCKLGFVIGAGLDNWASDPLNDEGIEVVDLSQFIELEAEAHEGEEATEADPHYWLSISNAIIISREITSELERLDPENASVYQSNFLRLERELNELKSELASKVDSNNNKIITFHDAFGYFADDLGLEVLTTIEPFPGKDPTAAYLAEVGEIIKQYQVKVLFKEPQLSDSVVQALADDYDVEVFTLDPLGGTTETDSYQKLISYNLETITNALAR